MARERLTVILPTRDRARTLAETLASFSALDRTNLEVEFVVVDNGSSDDTQDVLRSFAQRLPLRPLSEARPGKCRALNRALAEAPLGDIVVFTDDDVSPATDWLQVVSASTRRWPRASVFGGRIEPRWPSGIKLPAWTRDSIVMEFGFALHDLGAEEMEYPPPRVPLGPNFWIRGSALTPDIRFDERLGPSPSDRTLGDETSFLRGLRARGLGLVHVPAAVVAHRVAPEALSARFILMRAVHYGKGLARTRPLTHGGLLERLPLVWHARRALATARQAFLLALSRASLSRDRRVVRGVRARIRLAFNLETIRLARARKG